jgi:aminodeoxyfutalosine synthase
LPAGTSAGEYRIVGSIASLDAACRAVEGARRLAGDRPVTGFSLPELAQLAGATTAAYRRLRDAGLEAVADSPVDSVQGEWVLAARDGGLAVLRLTVHSADPEPLQSIYAAGRLQEHAGGFRAFAPLPRTSSVTTPSTGYDDVKMVALARLLLRTIPSIQVDWPLYGPKLAQVALTVGADDVDGISAVDTGALGTRRSPLEEIKGNIRAAGLQAVERDGRFGVPGR